MSMHAGQVHGGALFAGMFLQQMRHQYLKTMTAVSKLQVLYLPPGGE